MPDASKPAISLWSAGIVGAVSLLLGYPAGLGLAARNWHRMGRRPVAYVHLVVGVVTTVLLVLAPDFATGLAGLINLVIAGYLFFQTKAVHEDARAAGFAVGGGGFAQGLLTVVGGWALALVPAMALGVALEVGDGGSLPEGDIVFGAGGTGCEVEGNASSFPLNQKIHSVAVFAREAQAGETVIETVTDASGQVVFTQEIPIDAPADCYFGDLPADAGYEPGTYVFEATIGRERLARGELTIVVPGASP